MKNLWNFLKVIFPIFVTLMCCLWLRYFIFEMHDLHQLDSPLAVTIGLTYFFIIGFIGLGIWTGMEELMKYIEKIYVIKTEEARVRKTEKKYQQIDSNQ